MRRAFKSPLFAAALVLALVALSGLWPALAQVPSVAGPYNQYIGKVITDTSTTGIVGTQNSAQQNNLAYNGVICTFAQNAGSGSASSSFAIQAFDSASGTYQTMLASGIIAVKNPTSVNPTDASVNPVSIMIYPSIQTTSLPAGMIGLVTLNMKLPRYWRIQQIISKSNTNFGTGTFVGGQVGCDYLK